MRRGTTPTLKIRVINACTSELKSIYITIKQGNTEVIKTGDDLSVDENFICTTLSQNDTLSFSRGYVWIQMRATTMGGAAIASDIGMIIMEDVLQDGVIE